MQETFDRLLATRELIAMDAAREGAEGIQEWTALAALDAVALGEQLGMLHDVEAERRRAVIQARLDDLGRSRSTSGTVGARPPRCWERGRWKVTAGRGR